MDLKTIPMGELWPLIRNCDHTNYAALREEYYRRFNAYVVLPSQVEFPIEVIHDLGLYSGHDLPVHYPCDSAHHRFGGDEDGVLPYQFQDGRKMLLCQTCYGVEYNDIES